MTLFDAYIQSYSIKYMLYMLHILYMYVTLLLVNDAARFAAAAVIIFVITNWTVLYTAKVRKGMSKKRAGGEYRITDTQSHFYC